MAPRYRIHGSIAAKPRTHLDTDVLRARHELVRRDMAHNARDAYSSIFVAIGAAVATFVVLDVLFVLIGAF